jgi:ribosome-associated heat shock protein Hsp15
MSALSPLVRVRLDKWLWAARMYKTRALAVEAIGRGQVSVNGAAAKPAHDMRVGDRLALRQRGWTREVVVVALGSIRGPASAAAAMYEETADSLAAHARALETRRLEPAAVAGAGRPTKRDRRALAEWDRWSASAED